ncbi:MAG: hypothetical protein EOP47_03045 [Sphingobacteriaceae bacterium]|nr:MAG: hypothetical protein EOP47_03045 [Sphingobacteriaceae bacterium]
MKPIFFSIICMFCLSSCSQQNNNDLSKLLIGEWDRITTTYSQQKKGEENIAEEEISIDCNVCPTVVFLKNETGVITLPNSNKNTFQWKIESDKLIVKNNKQSSFIKDGSYHLNPTNRKEFTELELIDTSGKLKYILSR